MKILIALFTLFISTSIFAADRNAAYNLICKPLPFESERNQCINIIKPFSYFDAGALKMCAQFPFTNTKFECLGYIGNKEYMAYEIEACQATVFDTKKLECLRDNGTVTGGGGSGCLPNQDVLLQLRAAQQDLNNGQLGSVDKRLTFLIAKFSNPNCR